MPYVSAVARVNGHRRARQEAVTFGTHLGSVALREQRDGGPATRSVDDAPAGGQRRPASANGIERGDLRAEIAPFDATRRWADVKAGWRSGGYRALRRSGGVSAGRASPPSLPRHAEGIRDSLPVSVPGLMVPTSSSYTAVVPPQIVVSSPQVLNTYSPDPSTLPVDNRLSRLHPDRCHGPSRGVIAMHCPFCRHDDSRVVDSRTADDGTAVRRRRQCPSATAGSPPSRPRASPW